MSTKGELANQVPDPLQSQEPAEVPLSDLPPYYDDPSTSPPAYYNDDPNASMNKSGGYMHPPGHTTVITHQPMTGPVAVAPVKDYLGLAVFVTVCCCIPLGIVALLRSRDARDAASRNDYYNAARIARQSKKISIIGIVVGSSFAILFTVIRVALLAAQEHHNYN